MEDDDDFAISMSQAVHQPPEVTLARQAVGGSGHAHEERTRGKIYNDPIWGHIYLNPECNDVIDTPQFQRLRELKQLGTSYYVFPGATHNRFEHSIGVCHKSKETVELIKAFQPELEIDKIDIQAVAYAGLCHDLGHGPFSHVFENEFLSVRLAGQEFPKHEENSAKMFDYLVDYNQLEIDADVISRVKSLITSAEEEHGVMPKSWTHGKSFLREIVANGRN
ncbi:hypothetical protein CYMTET_31200, partial [Cymbomonas tetramitiformis]